MLFLQLGQINTESISRELSFDTFYVTPKLEMIHTTLKAGVEIFLKTSLSTETNNFNQTKPNQIQRYPGLIVHRYYPVA